jgi:ATP-dependent helicase HrpA
MTDTSALFAPATPEPQPPAIHYPPDLPISTHRELIADALRRHQVVIICGDTGSGKTTQLPKIALETGRGRQARIGCTQPRRLAAVTVAARVAEEFGQPPGRFIGYQHRFEQRVSPESRIVFMTDGLLLAETRRDRLLRAYDTLIIDEAHERSLNIDFLLGILQGILPRRPDLKLLISSATLDGERFARFFQDSPVLRIPGRLYPIDLRYRPPAEDDADLPRLVAHAVDELTGEAPGDVLVFLPGERDIRETANTLQGRHLPRTEIIPLLASLPAGEQQRAFRLSANRRIILATNVAETSVTIPGIRYVIDSGLARISRYHHRTRVQRLHIEPISQASANQRMGRCGRLGPGICIRLYDEEEFRRRDPHTDPEILRASLAGVILTMLDLRLGDITRFPFLDPPSPHMIKEGYRELLELGALAERPAAPHAFEALAPVLSPIGTRLARLPVEPRLGRILLAAHEEKALRDALIVVAAMECDDPRRRPIDKQTEADTCHARFLTPHSDFAALLQLWRWYDVQTRQASQGVARRLCRDHFLSFPRMTEWRDLRDQLERLCRELQLNPQSAEGGDTGLHRSLLTGLLGSIGLRDPETNDYRGPHGLRFALFPGSGLLKKRKHEAHPPPERASGSPRATPALTWLMAGEMVETSRLYARQAARIDPSWIEPLARHLCKYSYHSPEWDADKGYVRVRERVTLYGLVLVENRLRDYSRIAPAESRALFIRHALVAGEFPRPPPCLGANFARLDALRLAEQKTRRHGQLLDEERVAAFYDRRLPAEICNADALRRWARQASAAELDALQFGPDDLPAADIATGYPDTITVAGHHLPLTYHHNPGETEDGILCTLPAGLLENLRAWRAEWLVPGALPEKVHWMLSTLPGKTRRLLAPLDETVSMNRSPPPLPGRWRMPAASASRLKPGARRTPHRTCASSSASSPRTGRNWARGATSTPWRASWHRPVPRPGTPPAKTRRRQTPGSATTSRRGSAGRFRNRWTSAVPAGRSSTTRRWWMPARASACASSPMRPRLPPGTKPASYDCCCWPWDEREKISPIPGSGRAAYTPCCRRRRSAKANSPAKSVGPPSPTPASTGSRRYAMPPPFNNGWNTAVIPSRPRKTNSPGASAASWRRPPPSSPPCVLPAPHPSPQPHAKRSRRNWPG